MGEEDQEVGGHMGRRDQEVGGHMGGENQEVRGHMGEVVTRGGRSHGRGGREKPS